MRKASNHRQQALPNAQGTFTMTRKSSNPLTAATLMWLCSIASPAFAAVVPPMGTSGTFAVLGTNAIPTSGTLTCTNTGSGSTINGDVGSTFTSITNTGCAITGAVTAPVAGTVVSDFNSAYAAVASLNPTCDATIPTTSTALPPGVYCSAAGVSLGAGVTFTLNGNAADVWVFQVGTGGLGALTGNSFSVVMGGSANACNVYWRTAEAATMTDSNFIGTVLAGSAVTMTRGSWTGRAFATTDATVTDAAPLNFAGCLAPTTTITVNKDFIPNSVAAVPISLSCTSGTVMSTPLNASEGSPAVFTLAGADLTGTTCTATETVPANYTADQTNCASVTPGGACTITNTLIGNTITVNKDFIPNSVATVPVNLTCTSGLVDVTPQNASEAVPAVFTITGASPGATCTATETVPPGYTASQANCVAVALDGTCTITNTLVSAAVAIPAISGWAMMILLTLLTLVALATLRRAKTRLRA
jgi:hypothetical protein